MIWHSFKVSATLKNALNPEITTPTLVLPIYATILICYYCSDGASGIQIMSCDGHSGTSRCRAKDWIVGDDLGYLKTEQDHVIGNPEES